MGDKMDFDDILDHVDGWGRFQIRLLLVFIPFTFFLAYVGYAPILYLYVPDHWCRVPHQQDHPDNTTMINALIPLDEITGERSRCLIYDVEPLEATLGTANKSSWPTIPCPNGWEYNFTDYFHSVTTQFDWVCDDAWKPAFTQSVFYMGAICGTIFFGWTSDHYGRYWTFIASNLVIMVTGIATPFAVDFVSFCVLRFLMGTGFITFFMVLYMLTLEYVSHDKRSLVGNLSLAIAMSFGGIFQPWIMRAVGDWRIFHHILFCQTSLIFIAPWFVQESCRWLVTKGRIDEAVVILEKIAEENGRAVNASIYEKFKVSAEADYLKSKGVQLSCIDLFRTPTLRKNAILMILNWSLTSVLFDGHIRNIENLEHSIYWTFTLSSFLELPSDLLSIIGLEVVGRRWSAVLSLVGSGIAMMMCAVFHSQVMLVTIMAMVGRFFITYSMNTAAQISLETVPTELRGQGTALANVCAQVATLFAPQIVYSKVISPRAPFVILSLGGFVAGILAIFLPETVGTKLPDTIEEYESRHLACTTADEVPMTSRPNSEECA